MVLRYKSVFQSVPRSLEDPKRSTQANCSTHKLTPSSSSMISFPMEARVVHLQLLVARTAQRLWALNLHTEKHKVNTQSVSVC